MEPTVSVNLNQLSKKNSQSMIKLQRYSFILNKSWWMKVTFTLNEYS